MSSISRRTMLKAVASEAIAASLAASPSRQQVADPPQRKGHIRQSVSRWCYPQIPLGELSAKGAQMGLQAIDLLHEDEWQIPPRYGLICSMGYGGGGEIPSAMNRLENHAKIAEAFRKSIPKAAKLGVVNLITFSGNRGGMTDDEGSKNTVIGLNRVKKIAEDHGVTICMELLNSKVDHQDYMCDHAAWGVRVMQEVNSPRVKLLYDIYHMQIMEGDVIRTIRNNIPWIAHFHTGGVPGRHEIDGSQELNYRAVAQAIADTGFPGYVAHEFMPVGDPFTSLADAYKIFDV
jgi:hydroxypyruvate isomerase